MRRINILILFILLSICASAQNNILFGIDSLTAPGSVVAGDTIQVQDSLYNVAAVSIPGPITFGVRVNSVYFPPDSGFSSSDTVSSADSLAPGQGLPETFKIPVHTPTFGGFVIGPNTIVIWPIYNRGSNPVGPVDSLYIIANYDTLTGIAGLSLVRMFVFQTPGYLNINFGDAENLVRQVRICDAIGQGMYAGPPGSSKNIPTTGWVPGIYLCEIITLTGERRTIKFRLE